MTVKCAECNGDMPKIDHNRKDVTRCSECRKKIENSSPGIMFSRTLTKPPKKNQDDF